MTDGVMNLTLRMLPIIKNVTEKVGVVVRPLSTIFHTVDNITEVATQIVDRAASAAAVVKQGGEGLRSVADNLVELIETGDTSLIGEIFQGVAKVIEDTTDGEEEGGLGSLAQTLRTIVRCRGGVSPLVHLQL